MAASNYFFIESLGDLYYEVQSQKIFPDSKFFADSIPRMEGEAIVAEYERLRKEPGFDLPAFVSTHFSLPPELSTGYLSANKPLLQNLEELWTFLKRTATVPGGTVIPLPYPYIVPGGRFRELFYWDSYFTMLGLQASKHIDMMQYMVDNFAYLIEHIGFIPNGNRTYFISRSQPPFFVLMVELLAQEKGEHVLLSYLPHLEKEYAFWMDGVNCLSAERNTYRRVARLPDGSVLNRYWDDKDYTRPEAFFEDRTIAIKSGRPLELVQRHLRAACESGWDFSSRWLQDGQFMTSIETTNIVPVDLNCLLLHLEETLLKIHTLTGNTQRVAALQAAAHKRHAAIQRYCWDEEEGFYFDYHLPTQQRSDKLTMAAIFPLFFRLALPEQAHRVAGTLEQKFLFDGGLVTTLTTSGQQWDAPNGWAPLHWMAYKALQHYGCIELALKVQDRWMKNCEKVYADTGKMMEKYNVVDVSGKASGGKYPNQDGFGWTNGVYLRMKAEVPVPVE